MAVDGDQPGPELRGDSDIGARLAAPLGYLAMVLVGAPEPDLRGEEDRGEEEGEERTKHRRGQELAGGVGRRIGAYGGGFWKATAGSGRPPTSEMTF